VTGGRLCAWGGLLNGDRNARAKDSPHRDRRLPPLPERIRPHSVRQPVLRCIRRPRWSPPSPARRSTFHPRSRLLSPRHPTHPPPLPFCLMTWGRSRVARSPSIAATAPAFCLPALIFGARFLLPTTSCHCRRHPPRGATPPRCAGRSSNRRCRCSNHLTCSYPFSIPASGRWGFSAPRLSIWLMGAWVCHPALPTPHPPPPPHPFIMGFSVASQRRRTRLVRPQ